MTFVAQESVDGDSVAADVPCPTVYIHCYENSVPRIVKSTDEAAVNSNTTVAFDSILASDSSIVTTRALEQTSPVAVALDLTSSPELPTLEASTAARYS